MTTAIHINVKGTTPAPQGSKNPFGGEANKNTKPWRATVAAEAAKVMEEGVLPMYAVPVRLVAVFYFPRPKGHFGTGKNAGVLKGNAPRYKEGTPDLDKLLRAVGDSLSGVVVRDDRLIVGVAALKVYVHEYRPFPGVDLTITPA